MAPCIRRAGPMVYFGARGVMQLEATIYGPLHALHDGHYGNWVPNPAAMAANLLAQMRDDDGRILIPGFSDGVRALTPAEQAALKNLPPVGDALKKEFGIGRTEGSEDLPASLMRPGVQHPRHSRRPGRRRRGERHPDHRRSSP